MKILNTLNPYRRAASLIWNRLKWDINFRSFISRYRLKKMKGKYDGEKCVILCNGPSLLDVDFELLNNSGVYCFGLNKINLLFDKVNFTPDAIVSVNPFVIEQNKEFFNDTDIPMFLDSCAFQLGIKNKSTFNYLHSSNFRGEFAKDCSLSINQGHTVTFVAMQLAFHLGFKEVALVGCDHNFVSKGPANKTVVSGETDPNHFDPNYFSGGVKWQLPDLFQSEVAYQEAKIQFEESGRVIKNCTSGGKLEIFDRMKLVEFLS